MLELLFHHGLSDSCFESWVNHRADDDPSYPWHTRVDARLHPCRATVLRPLSLSSRRHWSSKSRGGLPATASKGDPVAEVLDRVDRLAMVGDEQSQVLADEVGADAFGLLVEFDPRLNANPTRPLLAPAP
jgi:hypothetical protein